MKLTVTTPDELESGSLVRRVWEIVSSFGPLTPKDVLGHLTADGKDVELKAVEEVLLALDDCSLLHVQDDGTFSLP